MLYLLFLIQLCFAFSGNSNSNVAVYWGQNSAGGEQSLATYCQSSDIDIVLLSFMNGFPTLELNFGGECNEQFSDGLLHCTKISQDIKTCQSLGKKVMLSLGGAVGTYGFSSDSDGSQFAKVLWNKFGGGSDDERPFDDAIIDGFDFDIENQNQVGYVSLANSLRQYFSQDSSKQYYLSAAPQCVYPDASVGDLLSQANIDFAFIQFYNNYCSLDGQFNWDTWKNYATNTSPNKNIKLYVGLPGKSSSAGSGYVDADTAMNVLNSIKNDPNFGGVMFWDASSVTSNGNYLQTIKNGLQGAVSSPISTSLQSPTTSEIQTSQPTQVSYQPTTVQSSQVNSYQPTTFQTIQVNQQKNVQKTQTTALPVSQADTLQLIGTITNDGSKNIPGRHTHYVTEYAYETVYITKT